ncbi:hypothetical protein [Amycolatopsis plumensis]|uniref:Peptidase M48 domain-containing protein n=2 Tax=Amycolatopsis plumensis TaxID=236508 RepID=A0ABV5UE72_9PSEU
MREYGDEIKKISTLITEYEHPASYWYLSSVMRDINSVAPRVDVDLGAGALPATLPLGEVNAMTVKLPVTGERIIFLDSGLVMFAHIMAEAVARAMPAKRNEVGQPYLDLGAGGADEIGQRLASVDQARQAIARAVIIYATDPQPRRLLELAVAGLRETENRPTVSLLFEGAIGFVVGHEYGHIVQGYASHDNWENEAMADAYGVLLSTAAMHETGGHDVRIASIGVDFFFGCLDLVYRAVSILRYGDEDHLSSRTHPDPATRLAHHRAMMRKNPDKEATAAVTTVGRSIERMLWVVWENMRLEVMAMRAAGVRPSSIWHL